MTRSVAKPLEDRLKDGPDRRTAKDFSAVELAVTRELDLSRICADLLDPTATHAQRETFLGLLLEELVASAEVSDRVTAFRSPPGAGSTSEVEHSTDSGRIDIYIELEDGRRIAIENKPWASDQPEQIDGYLSYLHPRSNEPGGSDGPDPNVLLLYWSGDGNDPQWPETEPPKRMLRNRCITMPYRKTHGVPSVEGWLLRCKDECGAPRVQWFLEDLIQYVVRWFPDVTHLLNDHVKSLGAKRGMDVETPRGGWLFRPSGWEGDWTGIWIDRQNRHSLSFDVGASDWPDDADRKDRPIKDHLIEEGKRVVGDRSAWSAHEHNYRRCNRHVSWVFNGEMVFRTDPCDGVNEIMELVEVLLEAADSA